MRPKLNGHDILRSSGRIRAILHLHNYRTTFKDSHGMPLADWDVQGHDRAIGHQVEGVSKPAILVIKQFLQMSTETDYGLGSVSMPMNRKRTVRFNRIQHPLGAVRVRVPQIVIHPEPRRCLRLGRQIIQ